MQPTNTPARRTQPSSSVSQEHGRRRVSGRNLNYAVLAPRYRRAVGREYVPGTSIPELTRHLGFWHNVDRECVVGLGEGGEGEWRI